MQTTRTSENDPLRIAAVTPGNGQGRIGIILCPGKTDRYAMSGPVDRDLPTDLDAIRDWGATAVVSLITDEEIDYLGVSDLERGGAGPAHGVVARADTGRRGAASRPSSGSGR